MKNRFKFRVWDKLINKYVNFNPLCHFFNDKSLIIEQFTGILDKNGKEIYEGDILEGITPNHQNLVIDFVSFEQGSFVWGYSGYNINDFSELKIIGNLQEDPYIL